MTISIKHQKNTGLLPDWTQTDLDNVIAGNPPPLPALGTNISQILQPSDFAADHIIDTTGASNGDVLTVVSGQAEWAAPSGGSSPLTTKGDLYTYTTADARLPVGTDGQALIADSSQSAGIKWATLPSGTPAGSDTQVQFNSSGSFGADSGFTWDNTNKRMNVTSTGVQMRATYSGATYTDMQTNAVGEFIITPSTSSSDIIMNTSGRGTIVSGAATATAGVTLIKARYDYTPAQTVLTEYSSGGIGFGQYMYQDGSSTWLSSFAYGALARTAFITNYNGIKVICAPSQDVAPGNALTTQPTVKFSVSDTGVTYASHYLSVGTPSPTLMFQVSSRGGMGSDGQFYWGVALTGNARGVLTWDTDCAIITSPITLRLTSQFLESSAVFRPLANTATNKVIVFRGASGQTANLTEWQDSSAAILSGIKPTGALFVPEEAYGAGWNSSTEVPTKNAVYDKVNSMFTGTTNITVSSTAPATPTVGDLWVDTN